MTEERVSPEGSRSFAYNGLPSSHIIGETKMVPEGLRTFLHEIEDTTFEKEWKKRNDEDQVSPSEALVEMVARFTDEEEWVEDNQRNHDYLAMLIEKDKFSSNSLMNHGNVTVLFNNVSMLFVKKVLEYRSLGLQISDKPRNTLKMGFWVPPSLNEDNRIKEGYAQVYANLNDIKNGLINEMGIPELEDPEEIKSRLADVSRIMPWGSQVIAGMTAGLGTWRHLFYQTADWDVDSEIRFVFLHLAYKMKQRYGNIFQDMVVINRAGDTFGFGTILSSLDAWTDYRIHFKDIEKATENESDQKES